MHIEVKLSPIHGQGLFAARPFRKGQIIGRIEGTPVNEDGPHVLWLDEQQAIHVQNDLRFINHHDQPNAAYRDDLVVVALRTIKAGEEITHDYDGGW